MRSKFLAKKLEIKNLPKLFFIQKLSLTVIKTRQIVINTERTYLYASARGEVCASSHNGGAFIKYYSKGEVPWTGKRKIFGVGARTGVRKTLSICNHG